MYRLLVLLLALAAVSDVSARDRHMRTRVVVGGHWPAVRVYTRHYYSVPRYYYRPSYYRSYAPAPRYYYPPLRPARQYYDRQLYNYGRQSYDYYGGPSYYLYGRGCGCR